MTDEQFVSYSVRLMGWLALAAMLYGIVFHDWHVSF